MPRLSSFPDAWVMLRPASAYTELSRLPGSADLWHMFRRPLLFALLFGCAVSLMTSGRLTLRLFGPAAIYWTIVPLLEIASLAVVGRFNRRLASFSRKVDLQFMGHAPWSLWLTAFAAMWAFIPPIRIFSWTAWTWTWYALAFLAAVWSAYIDFWFYRRVLADSPVSAMRGLIMQRLICWPSLLVCFVTPAGWQTIATKLRI